MSGFLEVCSVMSNHIGWQPTRADNEDHWPDHEGAFEAARQLYLLIYFLDVLDLFSEGRELGWREVNEDCPMGADAAEHLEQDLG